MKGINLVVAVTDKDWYETLRHSSGLDEVNFWSPSGTNFKALQPGELFLFKLRAPRNAIVGGGIFAHASVVPLSLAWEAFEVANGAPSLQELRQRIAGLLKNKDSVPKDFKIGCRILTQPFFLEEQDWIPAPASWAKNIVTLKTYNTSDGDGLKLWEAVQNRRARGHISRIGEQQARYGQPGLIRPRLGQGGFRTLVRDVYDRRCAITRERTLPALEAAHIRPYKNGGDHEARNGLLLRRDLHKLFDDGYVTVTPDLHFEVSRSIKEEFENGRDYYALHGKRVSAPKDHAMRPDPQKLRWHNENCFLE